MERQTHRHTYTVNRSRMAGPTNSKDKGKDEWTKLWYKYQSFSVVPIICFTFFFIVLCEIWKNQPLAFFLTLPVVKLHLS